MNSSPSRLTSAVDCAAYAQGRRLSDATDFAANYQQAKHADGFVWLGLRNPSRSEMNQVANVLGLSTLVMEQATAYKQRPKLLRLDSVTCVVLKTAKYVREGDLTETSEVVETGHIVLLIGADFVVTVRRGEPGPLRDVRTELEHHPDRLAHGPWAVFAAVAGAMVSTYGDIVDEFEDVVDDVEGQVFSQSRSNVQQIYQLKRELVEFRRAVSPLTQPLQKVASGEVSGVPEAVAYLASDLVEQHHRVTQQVVSFDDLLTSILQVCWTQTGIQQNDDMRKISAWAAIAAVQTTIAGIYGMNFEHMPELGLFWGYPAVLLVMVTSAVVLYRQFRRSGWL
ncbi:MAG: magnesium and cobalt transport protein CorA [Corynebacteriales bacterium]|nr:magnesium and cobalt transport protein CorA [Mycobacteriales bacterium]